jgi:hypothetical protein
MVLRRSYQSSPCFAVAPFYKPRCAPTRVFPAWYAHTSFSGPHDLHTLPETGLLACHYSCSLRARRHETGGPIAFEAAQMRAMNAICGLSGHAEQQVPNHATKVTGWISSVTQRRLAIAGLWLAERWPVGFPPAATSLFRSALNFSCC